MNVDPFFIEKKPVEIQITYLLDILFLLLILFILYSVNAKPYISIPMDLSKSSQGVLTKKKEYIIELTEKEIFIQKRKCQTKIINCLKDQNIKIKDQILIRSSKNTSMQRFIFVFDELKVNHYKNLSIEVEKL